MDRVRFRTQVLARHLQQPDNLSPPSQSLRPSICLQYSPPELSETIDFDTKEMRKLMDGHNWEDRDLTYGLMIQSELFGRKERGGKVFVGPDFNQSMEHQREMTMKRIGYLLDHGLFDGFLTGKGPEHWLRIFALCDAYGVFDHSLGIKLGVHFFLW